MKNLVKNTLVALVSAGSLSQAAPQICRGEDRQVREAFYLRIAEIALPIGTRVDVTADKTNYHYYSVGRYEVLSHFVTGMGTYLNLKFISGNVNRNYQLLIGQGKIFLVTDKSFAQLFCE